MADTLDIITLAAAKTAINMDSAGTANDAEVGLHITAVSRIVDSMCGPVVQRTITGEVHESNGDDIVLRYSPVASIGTVRESVNGIITTLDPVGFGATTDGYRPEPFWTNSAPYSGVLQRRWAGTHGRWTVGAEVEVTYVAGRFATTAAVDARFTDTAGAILRRLWKREAGSWAQSSSFFEDNDGQAGTGFFRVAEPIVKEMLGNETRLPGHA